MWIVKDKDGNLQLFIDKPIKKDSKWDAKELVNNFTVLELPQFVDLKFEDDPIEVNIFTQPDSIEDIKKDSFFKAIYDVGKCNGKNEYIEYLRNKFHFISRCDTCKNYGHPWCCQGILCDEYEWNIEDFIGETLNNVVIL